jgi:hypothetical protein
MAFVMNDGCSSHKDLMLKLDAVTERQLICGSYSSKRKKMPVTQCAKYVRISYNDSKQYNNGDIQKTVESTLEDVNELIRNDPVKGRIKEQRVD